MPNLDSNFTYGLVRLEKIDYVPGSAYHRGHSLRINTFWDVVEGAKIGTEAILGRRINKDRENGPALRLNFLFYYDF